MNKLNNYAKHHFNVKVIFVSALARVTFTIVNITCKTYTRQLMVVILIFTQKIKQEMHVHIIEYKNNIKVLLPIYTKQQTLFVVI